MPDINLQYVLAVGLIDGAVTFQNTHDEHRIHDREVRALMSRIDLVHSDEMEEQRQAHVEIQLTDGIEVARKVFPVRGTKDDPMERHEVESKARDLLGGVAPTDQVDRIVETVWNLEDVKAASDLAALLVLDRH
jgi:2-methylcitrate dehydratase PrpD